MTVAAGLLANAPQHGRSPTTAPPAAMLRERTCHLNTASETGGCTLTDQDPACD